MHGFPDNLHIYDDLIPVKLIWGEADPYLNTGVAEDFRSDLKHSSRHVLSAGHWLQIDAPEQVGSVMLS